MGKADGRTRGRRLGLGLVVSLATLSGAAVAGPDFVKAKLPPRPAPSDSVLVLVELTEPPTAQVYRQLLDSKGPNAAAAATAAAVAHLKTVREEQRSFDHNLSRAGLTLSTEIYRLQRTFNGIALKVRKDELKKLAAVPGVKAVHPVKTQYRSNSRSMPFLGVPAVWESLGLNGEGIKVGIIDTGIDYLHVNFGGNGDYSVDVDPTVIEAGTFPTTRVVGGWDFGGAGYDPNGEMGPPQDVPHPDPDPMDFFGHGTHVAGTVGGYGVTTSDTTYAGPWDASTDMSTFKIGPGAAPLVDLYALKVFGDGPDGSNVVEAAVEWAVDPDGDGNFDDHLDVVNLSLGGLYGSSADASQIVYANAVRAGVTVVAAAGNGGWTNIGDTYFVHSDPAGTPEVIAVAATHHDASEYPAMVRVLDPMSAMADYPAVLQDWAMPLDTTGMTGELTLTDPPDGCDFPVNDITGKIAVVDYGDYGMCDVTVKTLIAQLSGATGIVVISPYVGAAGGEPYTDYGMPITIPAAQVALQDGAALKAAMATDVLTANLSSTPVPVPDEADKVTFFSSRGPSRAGSHALLKPDVSAPGMDIFSSLTRTGTDGVAWGGTSMATPHVAGIMALMREGHPTWSPGQLKAALMNTAGHDVMAFGTPALPVSPARGGAGRVDPAAALAATNIAYDILAPEAVSLTFHTLDVVQSTTEARTIRVENNGNSAVTYGVSYSPIVAPPGVTITVPSTDVVVPAHGTLDIPVTLAVDAAALVRAHDATVDPVGRFWLSEASGYVVLEPLTGQTLRVPTFAALRPASDMSATGPVDTTGAVDGVGTSTITLEGTGVEAIAPPPYGVDSLVCALELMYRSPDETPTFTEPPPAGFDPVETNVADLKAVGINSTVPYGDPPNNSLVIFGLETYGIWGSPSEMRFDIYVKKASAPDWQWVSLNLDFGAQLWRGDVHTSCWFDTAFTGGWCFLDLLNIFGTARDTPVFLSDAMVLAFPTEALEMDADESVIEFQVVTHSYAESYIGAPIDMTPILRYDLAHPGVSFPVDVVFPDLPTTEIEVNYDMNAAYRNNSGGVLLIHHHNANGTRGEIVPVDGITCATDSDCPPSLVCDAYNGACVPCMANTDCYAGEICEPMVRDCIADCTATDAIPCNPGGFCDVYTKLCVADCRMSTAVPCIDGSFCRQDTGQCQVANALVLTTALAVGDENCPNGGIRLDSGLDMNGNGVLDQDEILDTDYVCEALETLVVTTEEEPGVNCEWGGQRIDSGLDADGDGVLDESEILETTYACSGPDGYQTIVNVTDEAPGENCPAGGKRIDVGADENRNGELDTGEIDETTYLCNGYASLTKTTDIAPGAACANGGTLMEIGLDENGDGELSPREVQTHEVICNEVAPTTVAPEGGSCSIEAQGSSGRGREALGVLALAGLALVRRRRR